MIPCGVYLFCCPQQQQTSGNPSHPRHQILTYWCVSPFSPTGRGGISVTKSVHQQDPAGYRIRPGLLRLAISYSWRYPYRFLAECEQHTKRDTVLPRGHHSHPSKFSSYALNHETLVRNLPPYARNNGSYVTATDPNGLDRPKGRTSATRLAGCLPAVDGPTPSGQPASLERLRLCTCFSGLPHSSWLGLLLT